MAAPPLVHQLTKENTMPKGKPSKGTSADKRLTSHKSKADQAKSAAKRRGK